MTSITLDFSDDELEQYRAKATEKGITLEDWFRRVAAKEAPSPSSSVAYLQQTNPEEWIRHLHAFVASLPKTPVLSDEAMSRESIYPDRS